MDRYPSITHYKKHKYSHSTPNHSTAQGKNKEAISFMMSDEGKNLYARIEQLGGNPVKIQKEYKDIINPSLLLFCITQYHLRKKGLEKWSYAEDMIFTETGLQQATSESISKHKAQKVSGGERVLIGCTGIGGEAIEIARKNTHITAVEMNPAVLAIAEHNVEHVTSVADSIEYFAEELISFLQKTTQTWDTAFIDPDRRINNTRKINIESYSPAFSELAPLLQKKTKQFFIKVAPALDYHTLWKEGYSIECIQEGNTVKELLIGNGVSQQRIATLIQNGNTYSYTADRSLPVVLSDPTTSYRYLYEPAGCIMRTELVGNIAKEHELYGLHKDSALLYSQKLISSRYSSFFTGYVIQAVLPFHVKNLRAYLREHKLERCIIKKRFFPIEPHEIRKQLKIKEGGDTILYFTTTHNEQRICVVCKRIPEERE